MKCELRKPPIIKANSTQWAKLNSILRRNQKQLSAFGSSAVNPFEAGSSRKVRKLELVERGLVVAV